jgi:hypothetical protein
MTGIVTKKYKGILDRALTGSSPKSAIHINCLICTNCRTNEIKECKTQDCVFHIYRPYQKNPHKFHKPTFTQKLDRCTTGKFIGKSTKSGKGIAKDIILPESIVEPIRLVLTLRPKNDKFNKKSKKVICRKGL